MSGKNPQHHRSGSGLWSLSVHAAMLGLLGLAFFRCCDLPKPGGDLGLLLDPAPAGQPEAGPPTRPPVSPAARPDDDNPPPEIRQPPVPVDNARFDKPQDNPETPDPDSHSQIAQRPVPPRKPVKPLQPVDSLTERLRHAPTVPARHPVTPTRIGGQGNSSGGRPARQLPTGPQGNGTGPGTPGSGNGKGSGGEATGGAADAAYDQLLGALCDKWWAEPSLTEMNNQRPTAIITVSVASNGQILKAVVSGPSGVAAMDNSVRRLCDRLCEQRLPPFSGFRISEPVITRQVALQTRK